MNRLKWRIGEHDFLQFISVYDVRFLNETWVSKTERINLDINGYMCMFVTLLWVIKQDTRGKAAIVA